MNRKRTFPKFIRSYFEGPDIGFCERSGIDPISVCGETCDPNQNDGPAEPERARETPPSLYDALHDPEGWRGYYGRLPGHEIPDMFFRDGHYGTFRNAEVG